jgi:transposase
MAARKRRQFTAEQKSEAVKLVEQVGNLSQVARDLDLHPNVLRNWVRQAEIDAGRGPKDALTTEEKRLVQKLMRENKRLRMERDFLKKAAAFFAREDDSASSS